MKNDLYSNIMNYTKKLKVNILHYINIAIHSAITRSIIVCMSTSMLWFMVSGQVEVKNAEGTTVGAVETRIVGGLDGVWVGLLLLVGAIDVLGAKLGRAVGSSIGAKEGVKVRSSVGIIVGNLLTGDLLG